MPPTPRRLGWALLALLAALALGACSSDDDNSTPPNNPNNPATPTGGVTVNSASGTYELSGYFVRCSGSSGNYTLDLHNFSSGQDVLMNWNSLTTADCSDAGATPGFTITLTVTVGADKSVDFTATNNTTVDPNPPGGTTPVTGSKIDIEVTETSDPGNIPVGFTATNVYYVDDTVDPVRLYEEAGGATKSDGYADFLTSVDYVIPGQTPIVLAP